MILSLPYYAVAQESKKRSIADSVRLPLIPKQKFLAGLLIKKRLTRNIVIDPNGKIVFLTRQYNENEMVKVINKLVATPNEASL
ncbi:hypothetical protein [uncultured Mucilaginibacter sp.]|uniref:hypothetical protein n=1 Tax=uncultured Mucilaginibacter sp. TaxID=797541 RepID=UPI002636D147|nr:hypothetical protein [uncultured Mucilaginibacter sp.]